MANFLDDIKMQEVVHSGLTYWGYAWPGTPTSEHKWKIARKVSTSSNNYKIEYALPPRGSGTLTDFYIFAWDDRDTITSWG